MPSQPWRIQYDVLAGTKHPPAGPADLHNLQVNRMVHAGDRDAFVARLVRADYSTSARPASPGPPFLFELSRLHDDVAALHQHCGI